MPYSWTQPESPTAPEALTLWAHHSLAPKGFVWIIALTAAGLSLPIFLTLGDASLWVFLVVAILTVAGLWAAIRRNQADRAITERLTLTPDQMTLTRQGPRRRHASWQANPHWVRLTLHATAGPVPNYLTLTGGGREVELGAFLTEAERIALKAEVEARLSRLK